MNFKIKYLEMHSLWSISNTTSFFFQVFNSLEYDSFQYIVCVPFQLLPYTFYFGLEFASVVMMHLENYGLGKGVVSHLYDC